MHFASPYYLWLLTALVPMAGYYVWRTLQGGAAIQISSVDGVVRAPKTIRYYLRHLPFVLRAAVRVGVGSDKNRDNARNNDNARSSGARMDEANFAWRPRADVSIVAGRMALPAALSPLARL